MEPRFTVIKKRPKVVNSFGRWGGVGVESPKVVEFDHLGALSQNMDQPHGCFSSSAMPLLIASRTSLLTPIM